MGDSVLPGGLQGSAISARGDEPWSEEEAARFNLMGASAPFLDAMRVLRRVASCDVTVLIRGETGTGKELAARAVHYLGARRNLPFIPVNCGAVPDHLVESELFGHTRGAFTDARESRPGVIGQADGGTLFLDEIEAMSPHLQVALLRFLQDREYRPVGGSSVLGADVRIVAASNVDLKKLSSSGGFRADLLYRFEVVTLDLPPLRERGDDVILLAQSFTERFCHQYGKPVKQIAPEARNALRQFSWPGNVRELENLIHRQVVLDDSPTLKVACILPPAKASDPRSPTRMSFRDAKERAIEDFERAYITALLNETNGNVSHAARLCGKERSRLGKLLKKYRLERSTFNASPARA